MATAEPSRMSSVEISEGCTGGKHSGSDATQGHQSPSDPVDATDTQGLAKSVTDRAMACGQVC